MIELSDADGSPLRVRLKHASRMPYMAGETGGIHSHEAEQHVIFYSSGQGRIYLREGWRPVRSGQIWLIDAHAPHAFSGARRDPHTYLEATFFLEPYRPLTRLIPELAALRPGAERSGPAVRGAERPWKNPFVPEAGMREDIASVLSALGREAGHNRSRHEAFEELRICELILTLARAFREAHADGAGRPEGAPGGAGRAGRSGPLGSAELVEAVRIYLRKNYRRPLAMEELAGYVGRSASTIAHVFKKATRRSIGAELRLLRLARAKELLRNSDYAIGRIAELCGFGDAAHFSRVFKKNETLSPRDYRAQLTGE